MDANVVLFLALIILAGGGIGLLADWLGRRIGKRRHTILRLRPKHTAQLITFLTGMLVSLLTIALVFALSADVRRWITTGQRAIREVQQLQTQRKTLEATIQQRSDQVGQLDGLLKTTKQELTVGQAKLTNETNKLTALSASFKLETAKVDQARARLAASQALLAKSRAALAINQRKLADARLSYKTLQQTYKELDDQRQEAFDRIQQTEIELDQVQKSLDTLKAQQSQLQTEKARLQSQVASAQEMYGQEVEKLRKADMDLEDARKLVAQESALVNLVKDQETQLAIASLTQPLLFGRGEELTRYSAPAKLTYPDALAAVDEVIRDASLVASRAGASSRDNTIYSAGLVPRTENGVVISVDDQRQGLARKLAGRNEPQSLVASSLLNSFRSQFVALDVQVYPDPIVYHKGQVIAEAHVDKGMSKVKALQVLNDFVKDSVYTKALRDGMLPVNKKADSLITVSPESTFATIDELATLDAPARLEAIALDDVRAADSLEFRLVIK